MTEPARRLAEPAPAPVDPWARTQPAPGRAGPARGHVAAASALSVVAPRSAGAGGGPRLPLHVAVVVGVSAGMYALSLAGVTGLQAATNAQLTADGAPAADAIARLKASHDALDAGLARLGQVYTGAAASYAAIAQQITDHEQALSQLGKQVTAAEGSASSLSAPSFSRLPSVSTRTVVGSSRPAVNACTTASGKPC